MNGFGMIMDENTKEIGKFDPLRIPTVEHHRQHCLLFAFEKMNEHTFAPLQNINH